MNADKNNNWVCVMKFGGLLVILSDAQKSQYEMYLQDLRSRLPEFLRLYNLPTDKNFLCVNPEHVHNKNTGSMSYDSVHNKVHCFGNCVANPNFDIFDMAGFLENIDEFKDKVRFVADLFGVEPFRFAQEKISFFNGNHNFLIRDGLLPEVDDDGNPLKDCTSMINAGLCNINKAADYLQSRGIRRSLAYDFCIGYLPKFNFLGTDGVGVVIPVDKYRLSVRDISGNFKDRYLKFGRGVNGSLFNPDAIVTACESGVPVFVTEGEMDALSIISVGGQAVALRGKEFNSFLFALDEAVKKTGKKPVVILACDNDVPGMNANRELYKLLKGKDVESYCLNTLFCGCKDMNEALCVNPEEFKQCVRDICDVKGLKKLVYYQGYNAVKPARSIHDDNADKKFIATGFTNLDKALHGGLFPGFYFLGASPGFGKSTLAIQIAENISRTGQDVLYFGMEMSQEAIVSRSLSRLTFYVSSASGYGVSCAKDSRSILLHEFYNETEKAVFDDAFKMYEKIGYHMIPVSGIFNGTEIFNRAKMHYEITGQAPVVFVDYLQIMASVGNNTTDKQNIDANIKGLVDITTKLKSPVFIMSSFNRNRNLNVGMTNFSGSSGIESYADCLMVLDFVESSLDPVELRNEKHKFPRKIVIHFLKNRYGDDSASIKFDYYAKYNYFEDTGFLDSESTMDSSEVGIAGESAADYGADVADIAVSDSNKAAPQVVIMK